MRILLVNSNTMAPPIAPLALDYLAEALRAQRHDVELLDLCFEADASAAVRQRLAEGKHELIGISFRNTDDCYYPGRSWFLPVLRQLVQSIRAASVAPVILGGVGFSIMPEAILLYTEADAGIVGEGEFALPRLAAGEKRIPGVLWRDSDRCEGLPPNGGDLASLPPMRRDFADNQRYYREGGQIGFESKRGCAASCIYCADPLAKGRFVRLRRPQAVGDELLSLADRGIVHLHTCDAEFNRPPEHALAVCDELIARGLGGRLRWYAYCAPTPFPPNLASAMRRAGCVGINFGADSGDDDMLRHLGRDFHRDDIRAAVELCRREGIVCMIDLLLGGPGETADSVRRTLDFYREVSPDRIGLSVGARIYPGTSLARIAAREPQALRGPGVADGRFVAPAFYISTALGEGIFPLVAGMVGDDRRFFFSDPTAAARNYNYSGNDVLVDAIQRGYRGAYWDILRRLQEGLPPA